MEQSKPQNIIVDQYVTEEKRRRARELRRAMTPEERILWQHLRDKQIAGFHLRRQQVIDGFIVDFYCHAARLVVEVDGGVHRSLIERDEERSLLLAQHGVRIIRFNNRDIRECVPAVLAEIRRLCENP